MAVGQGRLSGIGGGGRIRWDRSIGGGEGSEGEVSGGEGSEGKVMSTSEKIPKTEVGQSKVRKIHPSPPRVPAP